MVPCDIGRAGLLVLLPFWDNIWGLVILSFVIEVLTLLWGPAKDATRAQHREGPRAARVGELARARRRVRHVPARRRRCSPRSPASRTGSATSTRSRRSACNRESLAIWVDARTFLVSALLISRLRLDESERGTRTHVPARADVARHQGRAAVHPLEPARARRDDRARGRADRRRRDRAARRRRSRGGAARRSRRRSVCLMTALGVGAAIGVVTLLWFQRRLPRAGGVHDARSSSTGVSIIAVASMSSLLPAFALVAAARRGRGLRVCHRLHACCRRASPTRCAGARSRRSTRSCACACCSR